MNLNPIIIQRKNLQKKLWEIVRPQNAHEEQVELGAYRRDFYEECGFNLPIELNTAPSLYRFCQSVKDKLNVQDDVWFQIQNKVSILGNSIVSGNDRFPSIIRLSSGAISKLTEDELSFLIGHELGHIINKDVVVLFYFDYKYGKEGAPKDLAHKLKVFQLLSELEADRYAYLACGNLETYITYLYKSRGGLDFSTTGISIEQFLEGNHNRAKFFIDGGFMSGDTHPYDAIRIEALYIFATSKDARELCSRMFPLVYYLDHCTL